MVGKKMANWNKVQGRDGDQNYGMWDSDTEDKLAPVYLVVTSLINFLSLHAGGRFVRGYNKSRKYSGYDFGGMPANGWPNHVNALSKLRVLHGRSPFFFFTFSQFSNGRSKLPIPANRNQLHSFFNTIQR